jgi:hypothetical protein
MQLLRHVVYGSVGGGLLFLLLASAAATAVFGCIILLQLQHEQSGRAGPAGFPTIF